jgi:hypothetical protein
MSSEKKSKNQPKAAKTTAGKKKIALSLPWRRQPAGIRDSPAKTERRGQNSVQWKGKSSISSRAKKNPARRKKHEKKSRREGCPPLLREAARPPRKSPSPMKPAEGIGFVLGTPFNVANRTSVPNTRQPMLTPKIMFDTNRPRLSRIHIRLFQN